MAARTATPFLTTTLAIAAATAAIMVGCSRHNTSSSDAAASSGAGIAYDPNTGGTTNAHATASGYHQGDSQPGPAAGENTTGNAATGVTQPGTMGEAQHHGAPAPASSVPQSQ